MSEKVFCNTCRYIKPRVDDEPEEWESYAGGCRCFACRHPENEERSHLSSWYTNEETFVRCKRAPSDINGNNDCPFYKPSPQPPEETS